MNPDPKCTCRSTIPGMHFLSCDLFNANPFQEKEKKSRTYPTLGIVYGLLLSIPFWFLISLYFDVCI